MSPVHRGMLLATAFAALWALVELIAGGVLSRYSPYQVVWTRYAVHLLAMLLILGWSAPASLARTSRPFFQILRSLLMLVMPASWVIARQIGVNGDEIMSVFWLSPLLVMVFAAWLLGERVSLLFWCAGAMACIGAAIVFRPAGLPLSWHLVLPLAMAASFSLYIVMTRSLRSETTRANLFYTALGVFIVLTPFMPAVWIMPSPGDLVAMVCVGLFGALTLLATDRMAAAAPVSLSAPLLALQLVFMYAGVALLTKSVPDLLVLVGLTVIAFAAGIGWFVAGATDRAVISRTSVFQGSK